MHTLSHHKRNYPESTDFIVEQVESAYLGLVWGAKSFDKLAPEDASKLAATLLRETPMADFGEVFCDVSHGTKREIANFLFWQGGKWSHTCCEALASSVNRHYRDMIDDIFKLANEKEQPATYANDLEIERMLDNRQRARSMNNERDRFIR